MGGYQRKASHQHLFPAFLHEQGRETIDHKPPATMNPLTEFSLRQLLFCSFIT